MIDWTAGLDVDDDPVAPSISERAMLLVNNHMPEGLAIGNWRSFRIVKEFFSTTDPIGTTVNPSDSTDQGQ